MNKDIIDYKLWPSAIVCIIPEDRVDDVRVIQQQNPNKIVHLKTDKLFTYLTHDERQEMENCPTCPPKCPHTGLEGEIDKDYEVFMRQSEDKNREIFMNTCLDYLDHLLPYSRGQLKYLLIKDGDPNRIIRAAKHALSHKKDLEACYIHLKPIQVFINSKISSEVMGLSEIKDLVKVELSGKLASYVFDKDLVDITYHNNPENHNELIVHAKMVVSKCFNEE